MPDACPCLWLEASFSILYLLAASACSLLWETVEQSRDGKALTWFPHGTSGMASGAWCARQALSPPPQDTVCCNVGCPTCPSMTLGTVNAGG